LCHKEINRKLNLATVRSGHGTTIMAVLIRLGLDLALKSSNSGGAQDEIKDKTAIA